MHAAARGGALGDRKEIVASGSTLDEAGVLRFPVSARRSVTLKGISEPVEVATVDWR
ncbi:MAG: hypothetical protein ACRDXD_01790 [Acidimicrobiia bacterium]